METLLVQTWYPMTVATNSYHHRLKVGTKHNEYKPKVNQKKIRDTGIY
jgi:hypothetical protein